MSWLTALNWQSVLEPETSGRLCVALLHSLWQVGLAALVAGVVGRVFCRQSVERSYAVHVAALVVSVIVVASTFIWLSPGESRNAVASATVEAPTPVLENDSQGQSVQYEPTTVAGAREIGGPLAGIGATRAKPQAAGDLSTSWERFAPWIAGLYAVGVAMMLARLVASVVGAEQMRRTARPLVAGPAAAALRSLVRQWNVRAVPALAHAERILVPTLVGLVRPTILLPTSALAGLTADELEMILAHELAHVRRRDMWVNLLQRLAEVALFFNPALWYLSRRIAAIREYCCDEFACRAPAARDAAVRVDYAAALLRVVELASYPNAAAFSRLATLRASGRSPSELRRRIARLLGEPLREPLGVSRGGLLFAAAIAMAICVAPSWLHSQTPPAAPAAYPPPTTEADAVVAAARERTFGLKLVPRISIRQRITSGQVAGMTKSSELSFQKMFEACGKEFDKSAWSGDTNAALAWNLGQLLIQTVSGEAPQTYSQNRYWDGADGWIAEVSTQGRHVYRYPSLEKLMEDQASIHALYFPHFAAAGGRLSWGGPSVEMEIQNCRPESTRYKLVGVETIGGVECDVYEGPQRMEQMWIAKSTGLVKAQSRSFMREELPNYYTELVREVAGRTFADQEEYRQWFTSQPTEVQEKVGAHWSATYWPGSTPGNLTVFSDYREIVPGVHWPMHCERIGAVPEGKNAYKYYRNAIDVTDVATKVAMEEVASDALPHEGDQVTDRRFAPDEPEFTYTWKGSDAESDIEGAWGATLKAKILAIEAKRKINEQPIDSVADAIKILTDGPKTDPTMIWARAIKYLVDHKDEGLPATIKQLDGETRDHAISKLAFALRAIGDLRAVPALIRALPRTLLPGRSDYGLVLEEDLDLLLFMQLNDQTGDVRGRAGMFDYGRAFREVVSALHRLTKQNFGEMDLNWVSLSSLPAQRDQQRKQFYRAAQRWAQWWESEGKRLVWLPAYPAVNVAAPAVEGPSFAGRQHPPAGPGVRLLDGSGSWVVQSAQETQKECFVDLDTGRQGHWPATLAAVEEIGVDSPEVLAWARSEGFDMVGITYTPPGETAPLYCMKPIDLHVWKMTEAEHRALGDAMAGRQPYPFGHSVELLIPQREVKPPYDGRYSGDAFLFVTREGTAGVIRMTAQVTEAAVAGSIASADDQFRPTGFHHGAKLSFAAMSEVDDKAGPAAGEPSGVGPLTSPAPASSSARLIRKRRAH